MVARNKCKKAEDTSDLNSESDGVSRRSLKWQQVRKVSGSVLNKR